MNTRAINDYHLKVLQAGLGLNAVFHPSLRMVMQKTKREGTMLRKEEI